VRFGRFRRQCDQRSIQRYRCQRCHHTSSDATGSLCYRQKKRQLNPTLFKLLTGGYSQRRAALDLKVNRKTVVRKFVWMGLLAQDLLVQLTSQRPLVKGMEFDDMESFEHTKCKPISITLAVEHRSRVILGFRVSEMPAKGKLAHISRAKYGPRKDERKQARAELFSELKPRIAPDAEIRSDQNPHYAPSVKEFFPGCHYRAFKGRRGCVVGQGELKRGGRDPLFSLNHTCAMLRANINRLFRRTWCTTKLKERL
jgi:hypothetical protein